ncbi:MAG: TlpA family protein disulfide reductase [Acidimicrobiia bacterium]
MTNVQTLVRDPPNHDLVERLDPDGDFNFRHFRMRHMVAELIRSYRGTGIAPGQQAPDFTLPTTDSAHLALCDLRGRPALLHFVSYTCPVTRGSVVPMKRLHELYGERVSFVDIVVRQAHPGEHHSAYDSFTEKLADAREYQREEAIPWLVAVDDLTGTVQRAYGSLAASIYLLDSSGRVAFYALWGQAPPLTAAIERLLAVPEGSAPTDGHAVDRVPHLGGAIVAGQRGPLRGGLQSILDLELGFPGAIVLMTGGWLLRPILAPLVQRTTPIPRSTLAIAMLAFATGVTATLCARRRRSN